jgi:DNA-directed RNA polymerase subunit M/transcription elongation factor TFIIS
MLKRDLLKKIITTNHFPTENRVIDQNIKRCKQCNEELLVLSRQTRSADEGSTTFYRCTKCCKTTKIN